MSDLPAVLQVEDLGDGRWTAPHPADDPEGRDVVFSGQILAQMIMASDAAVASAKEVKSIHAIFARAGTYSAGSMELLLEQLGEVAVDAFRLRLAATVRERRLARFVVQRRHGAFVPPDGRRPARPR